MLAILVKINNLRESLLEGFRGAWEEIATIGKKYPNVIGYDILNEPASVYLIMSIVLAYLELGSPDLVKSLLDAVVLDEEGNPRTLPGGSTVGELGQQLIEANLSLLPKDNSDETRKALGLYGADLMKVLGLNIAIDKNSLEPLYEYVGEGIMKVYARDDHPRESPDFGLNLLIASTCCLAKLVEYWWTISAVCNHS